MTEIILKVAVIVIVVVLLVIELRQKLP